MKKVYLIILIFIFTIAFTNQLLSHPEFNIIYVIQEGDTLSEIAQSYGISTRYLLETNGLNMNSMIRVGQELLIPNERSQVEYDRPVWDYNLFSNKTNQEDFRLDAGNVFSVRINPSRQLPDISHISSDQIITYHVDTGDTLYDLAKKFNTSSGIIMALNNMENSIIRRGQSIQLPINNLSSRQVLALNVTDEDIELLARVIHGEARGEPFIGQVAVGAVVINRVLSSQFPNTFREVIYQHRQFSAVADGQFYLEPSQVSYRAAREALNGSDPSMGSLFYYNPAFANYQWWFEQRRRTVTIGGHVFTE
ncbi:cell wall hydrolase [Natronospora cellulosivora (SeqCode)]